MYTYTIQWKDLYDQFPIAIQEDLVACITLERALSSPSESTSELDPMFLLFNERVLNLFF